MYDTIKTYDFTNEIIRLFNIKLNITKFTNANIISLLQAEMKAISFIIALTAVISCKAATPQLRFAWKEVDFTWDSPEQREAAIKDGVFVKANNLPLGLARWNNKIFVTVPRWKNGVASSLNYIDLDGAQDQLLKPYPSLKENLVADSAKELPSNSSIISVFRVFVDPCDRLWVMDSGLADILGTLCKLVTLSLSGTYLSHLHILTIYENFPHKCRESGLRRLEKVCYRKFNNLQFRLFVMFIFLFYNIIYTFFVGSANQVVGPSLVIFDLNTNQLLHRYFFKVSDMKEDSFFANIVSNNYL